MVQCTLYNVHNIRRSMYAVCNYLHCLHSDTSVVLYNVSYPFSLPIYTTLFILLLLAYNITPIYENTNNNTNT